MLYVEVFHANLTYFQPDLRPLGSVLSHRLLEENFTVVYVCFYIMTGVVVLQIF